MSGEGFAYRLIDMAPAVELKAVEHEVAEVAGALLEQARFPDFVPLLAYRYTREHLLDDGYVLDDGYEIRRAA